MALLVTIAMVNASDSKYPDADTNTESLLSLPQRISLLSSENAALEILLDEAKSQITDLQDKIHAKRLAIKTLKAQQSIAININLYHGKNAIIAKTRGEEDSDDALLAASLRALDLKTGPESTPVPMLAAGAPEDFEDINEHQRLLALNGTLASKVTQSDEIIESLNTRLQVMLEDIEFLGANIDILQARTTKEEKNAYLTYFAENTLGMNKAHAAKILQEQGLG
jgi:hypothetical protein